MDFLKRIFIRTPAYPPTNEGINERNVQKILSGGGPLGTNPIAFEKKCPEIIDNASIIE